MCYQRRRDNYLVVSKEIMEIKRNIEYLSSRHLDIFIPEKIEATFVHFHGGGIVEGDKTDCDDLMIHLCQKNFLVFNVNYSLYPNTKFPTYLLEASKAVRYAFDHVEELGGNKNNIYLSGQSAGAYIIMMLSVNKEYLETVNLHPIDIKGYISDSGQLIDHFNVQHYEFGVDPWLQRITNIGPLYYVNKDINLSPTLLIYYSNDMLNRKEQNIMFYNLVKFYKPDTDITQLELKGNHVEGSCKKDEDDEYPYVKELVKWMERK